MLKFAVLELIIFVFFIVSFYVVKKKKYERTEYYAQTKNSFLSIIQDIGKRGEYYTYKYLIPLKGYKKYLFNLYLPKQDGETTEIDVLLLHESGIYIFESKNYSGWIFGSESQQYWTQTLPAGHGQSRKSHFFNPLIQNEVHIKWLRAFLENDTLVFYSYIIFSDRCTLKDIKLTSRKHHVINRYNILSAVQQNSALMGNQLSQEEINRLYEKLYPLTQVSEAEKAAHIQNVHEKQNNLYKKETVSSNEERCPLCGGKLLLRTASKGIHTGEKFWGCSNYPKCKYTKHIND